MTPFSIKNIRLYWLTVKERFSYIVKAENIFKGLFTPDESK